MQKQNTANLASKYEYHLFTYLLLLMSNQKNSLEPLRCVFTLTEHSIKH